MKIKIVIDKKKIEPKVKDVLALLGIGTLLFASFVMPGLPLAIGAFAKGERERRWQQDKKEWEKFNLWRLRQILKRLHRQKMVKVIKKNGEAIVVLTKKGKTKLLKYKLEEMIIKKQKHWDGKWRLIIYDIAAKKKYTQELFRKMLKKFKFLQLQKSVYLYPFDCKNEIEFLRQYYKIGKDVIILTISGLENEEVYKKYFGL